MKQLECLNPWFLGARLAILHPFIHVFAEQYPMPSPTLDTGVMEHPECISLVATVHVISSDDETHPAFQSSSKVFTANTELLFLLIHSSGSPGEHSAVLTKEGSSKGHISVLVFHFLICYTAE